MSRYIAVDAEQNQLYVASVIVKGNVLKVEKAISLTDAGPLNANNAAELGRRLKEAMKEAGIAPAPVLASVGRERVILKEVKYPASVAAADESALVKFQVSKELTEGAENVIVDYFALPTPDPDGQRRALAFALRKDLLAAARAVCLAAGLRLTAITPRPFGIAASLVRAIKDGAVTPPESAVAPMAVLVRGDKWGELVILRGGQVAFTRTLTNMALNSEAAMIGEVKRNLAVFAGQSPQSAVQALYVAEGDMPGGWSGRISHGLNIPVQPFDPIADVETDVAPEVRGCFAGLAGLAVLRARSSELPINFIEPREPKQQSDPNKRLLSLVGVAAALLFVGGLGIGLYLVDGKKRSAVALQNQKTDLEEDIKKLDDIPKRANAIKEWDDKGINWLDEFYDLTARFPNPAGTEVIQLFGKPLDQGGKATTKYAAELELTILTESGTFVDALAISMSQDRHYSVGGKQSKGSTPGGRFRDRKNQQYLLKALIERRLPKDYILKSDAEPLLKRPPKATDTADGFDLLGGAAPMGGAP